MRAKQGSVATHYQGGELNHLGHRYNPQTGRGSEPYRRSFYRPFAEFPFLQMTMTAKWEINPHNMGDKSMPRMSAEARGAATFQPDVKPHAAPENLTQDEQKVWYDIINSKPVDWFDQGSLVLLERYCCLVVDVRVLTEQVRTAATPLLRSFARKELNQTTMVMGNIATRCRLSVQAAVDRRNKILDEKGAGAKADDKLLGGRAVWGQAAAKKAEP